MKKIFVSLAIIILGIASFFLVNTPSNQPDAALASSEESTPVSLYETITSDQAKSLLDQEIPPLILDVRTLEEFATSHLPNTLHLPHTEITAATAQQLLPSKSTPILIYCHSGTRSTLAAGALSTLGYQHLYNLQGGISNWPYDVITDD